MSRFKRMYYSSAMYHVNFRGNNRQAILKNKFDKRNLLISIQKFQERKKFKIYGFVIMDNHAHMIIETNEIHPISKIMQAILLSFSVKYRRKYDYVGHVWQGRFNSKPILKERYLLECLEYIHNNPVKAEVVSEASKYIYSSARFYQGLKTQEVDEFVNITRYKG